MSFNLSESHILKELDLSFSHSHTGVKRNLIQMTAERVKAVWRNICFRRALSDVRYFFLEQIER